MHVTYLNDRRKIVLVYTIVRCVDDRVHVLEIFCGQVDEFLEDLLLSGSGGKSSGGTTVCDELHSDQHVNSAAHVTTFLSVCDKTARHSYHIHTHE